MRRPLGSSRRNETVFTGTINSRIKKFAIESFWTMSSSKRDTGDFG
jgi:hypothetical protein